MSVAVYVISLERQPERRQEMARRLARVSIAAAYVNAVDARDPANQTRLGALPDTGPWGPFAPHDKACTLSHLNTIAGFLKSDAAFALVLEDDARVSEELDQWLDDLSWWPAGADIVRLERWRDDKLYLAMSEGTAHLSRAVRRLYSRHSGGAGYLVSRAGAQKIIDGPRPATPIDHHLFNPGASELARDLAIWQIDPALVEQDEPTISLVPRDEQQTAQDETDQRRRATLRREAGRLLCEMRQVPRVAAAMVRNKARLTRMTFADKVMGK